MDFTDYGAEQTLRWVLGQTAQTPPAQLFVKLHIGDPGADGTGNPSGTTVREEYVPDTINAPGGGSDGNSKGTAINVIKAVSVALHPFESVTTT